MSNRFLDIFGMEHYHQLIKPVEIESTNFVATTHWTGEIDAAGLAIGKMIIYVLPTRGTEAGATTLELTLSNGTTTGEIPVHMLQDSSSDISIYPPVTDSSHSQKLLMFYNGEAWTILQSPKRTFSTRIVVDQTVSYLVFDNSVYKHCEGDEYNMLSVYKNGLLLYPGFDYDAEFVNNNIRVNFNSSLAVGTVIIIRVQQ